MANSTITLGYSIAGGMQVPVNRTITLGYLDKVLPKFIITLAGTLVKQLNLDGTRVSQLILGGKVVV